MKIKTLWLARTAVLLALLLALQFVTKGFGQLVTGSCVNLVLGTAALAGGLWCGVTVALLSPVFAYLLQIAPMPVLLVPGVAAGNAVFVLVLSLLARKAPTGGKRAALWRYGGAVASAAAKFAALWLVVVKLLLPLAGLPEQKLGVMTAMFTWPQLITALIGGFLAATVAPLVAKASRRP